VAIEASRSIYDSGERTKVATALARARGKRFGDADSIAASTQGLGSSQIREVLLLLVERQAASTGAVLAAANGIYDSSEKSLVLEALAKARGAGPDAGSIAGACASLGSAQQTRVLLVLADLEGAAVEDLVNATARIYDSGEKAKVLSALAAKKTLTAAGASRVASACASLGSAEQARVLSLLARGAATTQSLVDASKRIYGSDERSRLLADMAKLRAASEDAALIAGAIDGLGSSGQLLVLKTLIEAGGAPVESIVAASKRIYGSAERSQVLMALAKTDLSAADADRVAAGISGLGSTEQANVLVALIGRASRDTLIAAAKQIYSAQDRDRVLEQLARTPERR
jgi:hypothetical protein